MNDPVIVLIDDADNPRAAAMSELQQPVSTCQIDEPLPKVLIRLKIDIGELYHTCVSPEKSAPSNPFSSALNYHQRTRVRLIREAVPFLFCMRRASFDRALPDSGRQAAPGMPALLPPEPLRRPRGWGGLLLSNRATLCVARPAKCLAPRRRLATSRRARCVRAAEICSSTPT